MAKAGEKVGHQTIKNVIKRHRCQPCNEQKKKIMAVSWCTECLVGLCSNCHKHHDSLKLTRYHKVIPMRQFQSKITAGQLEQKIGKLQIQDFDKKRPNVKSTSKQPNRPKPATFFARKESPEPVPEVFTEEDLRIAEKMNAVRFTYTKTISLLKGGKTSIICDIKVLSNGDVLMADKNNSRLLWSEINGIKQNEFRLPGKPFCLTLAPDDTAAVSLYEQGKVVMVDIYKREIFREIVITCFGLVFTENYLMLNCGQTGLKAMDMENEVYEVIPGYRGDGYLVVANDGNVLVNCSGTNQILSCNIGRRMAKPFTKLSIEHPLGATIDEEGFVYEVGVQSPQASIISEDGFKASESVHMISSTGKHHRLVLTRKDGVNNPYAVHYDKSNNTLLIANDCGESVVIYYKGDRREDDESSFASTTSTSLLCTPSTDLYSQYSSMSSRSSYTPLY